MKKIIIAFAVVFLMASMAIISAADSNRPWQINECYSDKDCLNKDSSSEVFCEFKGCAVETGNCVEVPELCADVYEPVCGCDGKTYGNYCELHKNKVSLKYEGECKPVVKTCFSNSDCKNSVQDYNKPAQFCKKSVCDENKEGACADIPQICPALFVADPVCGCDGKTYLSECEANAKGVNVKHKGSCEVTCSSDRTKVKVFSGEGKEFCVQNRFLKTLLKYLVYFSR